VSVARRAHASRPHGRHLLRSSRLAQAIVRDAGVAPGDLVVDVGAGSGMLTRPLLAAGARVLALEPDRVHAARLRRACPRARVVAADARSAGWPGEPFRVVANLPFAHGTELLRSLLSDPRVPLHSADVIVQWELAEKRTRLWPSTAVGVLWAAWYDLAVVRRIPPAAFAPPPPVAAAVLRAMRRAEPLVDPRDAAAYGAFLQRAFRGGLPREARAAARDLLGDRHATARDLDARTWAEVWTSVRSTR
jgi:23S rRNA (adenine-N6)-dimethyltransferase